MIHIARNKELPSLFIEELKKRDNGKDFTFAITADPTMLFVILNSISSEEIQQIRCSFKLGSIAINGVPFLTLNYGKGLVFEFPIQSMDNDEVNALNIIFVERESYVVEDIRVVGMNSEVHRDLIANIKDIDNDISLKLQKIYQTYSTERICNHADSVIQYFKQTT